MVITRRANENVTTENSLNNAIGVQTLERSFSRSYSEYSQPVQETEETVDQTRLRMQQNLERILNYDKYPTQTVDEVESEVVAQAEQTTQIIEDTATMTDDDIRPTSTTMQFGDADLDEVYNEMNKANEQTQQGYKLTLKGKLVVAAYAVLVTLIFALIVINTGVLTTLSKSNMAKQGELSALQEYNVTVEEKISEISDDQLISQKALEWGMVKGN